MDIYNYEIISPYINTKKPHFLKNGVFVIPNIDIGYKFYLECRLFNDNLHDYEYFLLLSTDKADERFHRCKRDDYNRLKLKLHTVVRDYITDELQRRGTVNITLYTKTDKYDIYKIV